MRRLKTLTTRPDFLLAVSKGDAFRAVANLLPRDARVVYSEHDPAGNLVLTVESDTFPEVAPGETPPESPAPEFLIVRRRAPR